MWAPNLLLAPGSIQLLYASEPMQNVLKHTTFMNLSKRFVPFLTEIVLILK